MIYDNDKLGLSIEADPTFLYFDKEGFLVDTKVGYNKSNRSEFKEGVLKFVQTQQ